MAIFANIRCRKVVCGLSSRRCSIVTGEAIASDAGMVKARIRPRCGVVAVVAGVRRSDMIDRLSGDAGVVMAGDAACGRR